MNKLPLLIVLALSAAVAPAATFLDDFGVASPAVTAIVGTATGAPVSLGGGIVRSLTTGIETNAAIATGRASSAVSGGTYTFGTDATVNGWGEIDYRVGSLDLRGLQSFQIDFVSNLGATSIGLTLGDADTDEMLRPVTVAASASRFTLTLDIPSYVAEDLDLAHVTNLGLWIDPSAGGKLQIDAVRSVAATQPVPEPASVAALGLGAVALLRRRK